MSQRAVLNVGGGNKTIPIPPYFDGWRQDVLDINPNYRPEICLDARKLGTLPPATYDAVYCSHNLEHYHRHEAAIVVRGFHHILKPDGFAEIRVPNLEAALRYMVDNGLDIDDVLYTTEGGPILIRDVIYGYHVEIEKTGQDFFAHRTGFTPASLTRFLGDCGFPLVEVRPLTQFSIVGFAFRLPPSLEFRKILGIDSPITAALSPKPDRA